MQFAPMLCATTPVFPADSAMRLLIAGTCSVVVHGDLPNGAHINLAEVELYDLSGARIHRSRMNASTSSLFLWAGADVTALAAIDGATWTVCHTNSAYSSPPDWDPTLTVTYPCPSGQTSLSRVVVVNRQDCCQQSIVGYRMDFLNAAGRQDRASYRFANAISSYTITLGELRECKTLQ
jgi:hypothetical protein